MFADTGITSEVVGYTTADGAKNEWKLYAVQFDGIAGTTFKLQDFGNNLTGPAYDDDGNFESTAPMMQVRNAANDGYTVYYYLSDGKLDGDTYVAGWADQGGNPLSADVEITAGTAFWFLDQYNTSSSVTASGQVKSDATASITINAGWSIVASPYPESISFADMDFGTITGPAYDDDGNFEASAPMMQVRNAANDGYTVYYYLSDGKLDGDTYVAGWADQGGNPLADYSAKLINVGRPIWFNLQVEPYNTPFKLTFTK